MALIDRALLGAKVAFVNGKDYVTGSTSTPTAIQLDPIVSGSNFSYLFESGGAHSHSLTIPNLSELRNWTMVFYLFFSASSANAVVRCGGSPLISYDPLGFVTVSAPYSTSKSINFDTQMEHATQIAIVAGRTGFTVYADGSERGSMQFSDTAFAGSTSISMASETGITSVLGAAMFYDYAMTEKDLQEQFVEAFATAPDAEMAFDARSYDILDAVQDYVSADSIPVQTNWDQFETKNVRFGGGLMRLDLRAPEVYDEDADSFTIPNIGLFSSTAGGMVKFKVPSFSATSTERCLLHLKPIAPGFDEFAVIARADNRIQAYRKQFVTDSNGLDISVFATYGSASPALSNGTVVWGGFGWTQGQFSIMNNVGGGMFNTISLDFDPSNYSAVFGGPLIDGVINAAKYHADRASWNWVLRVFDSPDTSTDDSEYGVHTYYTSSTAQTPVRAEGYAKFNLLVPGSASQPVRKPYAYIDGKPNGTITEALV